MINKIDLGFGNEKSFLKKEKIIKIYNKGNIIISRPKSSKNEYKILSIKRYESPKITIEKKEKESYKKKKKRKEEEKIEYNENEDKIKNIGNILGELIKDEESNNIIDFVPYSSENKMKVNKKSEDKIINRKNKSYIPNIEYKEKKEIDERYLQRTINIYKENEYLVNRVNELLKKSKIINEEQIKKEKERKLKRINQEKNNIAPFINNKKKEIKYKGNFKFLAETEYLIANNAHNKNEENNNKKDFKRKNKKIKNKEGFINIIDIKKDKKYIEAENWLKESKEECEKVKDYIIKIDQHIKEEKTETNNTELKNEKKIKKSIIEKAEEIISEIKDNIDINNFNINKLNKEDKKLLKGGERYDPNKRIKNVKDININKNKESLLINSINSIKELKESKNNMKESFKKKNKLDKKEKEVSKKWKNENECAKAYLNNFKRGIKVDINEIKEKKNIELNNKNDIYNYIYMPKEYENHWYNKKDTKDKTEYRHPFLIYD